MCEPINYCIHQSHQSRLSLRGGGMKKQRWQCFRVGRVDGMQVVEVANEENFEKTKHEQWRSLVFLQCIFTDSTAVEL